MKIKLLKNTLLAISLIVCTISFGQIDYTFDATNEGFTVNGPGTSSSHSATTGILTATTGSGGSNMQLRKNANDVGDPTALTAVLIDLKNNSNANSLVLQTVSGGVTTIETIAITAADTAEQSYQIDVPDPSATWIGSFQLRLRFVNTAGNLDGGSIEVNRIQIVDPTTLSVKKNVLENVSVYPNPASGSLTINTLDGANIDIYNVIGKMVKSQEALSNSHTMDISDLSTGVYFVKLTSEGKTATKKLVIE
jgi:hypothetical protein